MTEVFPRRAPHREFLSYTIEIFVRSIVPSPWVPKWLRWRLLNRVVGQIENCQIYPGVRVVGRNLTIHRDAGVNYGCTLDANGPLTIGARAGLGMNCTIITSSHEVGSSWRRIGPAANLPVVIGEAVWMGADVTVMPGVTIGEGCIIGAGALVVKDCEPHGVYIGSPARRIKELPRD